LVEVLFGVVGELLLAEKLRRKIRDPLRDTLNP
jgi:hypothetical protein